MVHCVDHLPPILIDLFLCFFQDNIDNRNSATLTFDHISQYLGNATPLRNNANYEEYQDRKGLVELYHNNWLADKNSEFVVGATINCVGEVDRWKYAAQLTLRAMIDSGRLGGHCDVTITVRNAETQRNAWEGIELNEYAHNLLAENPDTAGAPPINSSHERWTQLANERIGLFHHLGEPFEDNPEHQAFGLKCGKFYFLLD